MNAAIGARPIAAGAAAGPTSVAEKSATPMKTSSAPAIMKRSTFVVPRPLAKRAKATEKKPSAARTAATVHAASGKAKSPKACKSSAVNIAPPSAR